MIDVDIPCEPRMYLEDHPKKLVTNTAMYGSSRTRARFFLDHEFPRFRGIRGLYCPTSEPEETHR
jgi:hypothetical protein